MRPYVWKRATRLELTGWVCNDTAGVTIELQGESERIGSFLSGFSDAAPPQAKVHSIAVEYIDILAEQEFTILASNSLDSHSTSVPPDIATCEDCLRELNDPENRRYGYPFTNCCNCGPRFTIIEALPYDRPLTVMKRFSMCERCDQEYRDPGDRRYHAQPNACPTCGPQVWFSSAMESSPVSNGPRPTISDSVHAIRSFRTAIEQGQIVAVKGIGGFHLACDATNPAVIDKLRQRKGRADKPLAIMVRDIRAVERFARVSQHERELLESPARPIVLLEFLPRNNERFGASIPHESIAPGQNSIGVMLPYSPLHHLLVDERPLVMTSGNLSDEPICFKSSDALRKLAPIADCFLLHDREIHVPCDDSVVRSVHESLLPIRRSRGYAPLPIDLSSSGPSVLAVGGELKSSFCVTQADRAYLSQHLGDLGSWETLAAFRQNVEHLLKLLQLDILSVVVDLHPDYCSGRWGEQYAQARGLQLIRVQHHWAHLVSLSAEHGLASEQKMIGCCFDGTGYGMDGAIWGGEFLIADQHGFKRFAHLANSPLPGGDTSLRRPYRLALAQLWSADLEWSDHLPCVQACPTAERRVLRQQLEKDLACVPTSSLGRLFDAFASLLGVRQQINYEAQAAIELEAVAAQGLKQAQPGAYQFRLASSSATGSNDDDRERSETNQQDQASTSEFQIQVGDLLHGICRDMHDGVAPAVIAAQFHHAVAQMVVEVCCQARTRLGLNLVGLSGGVFQNVLLLRLVRDALHESGFEVLVHQIVPPNDGGLALGQAIAARHQTS